MINPNAIGKCISLGRQDKGFTQEELANKLGITPQAVSRWERGNAVPDIEHLMPLSQFLDIAVEDILTGGNAPKQSPTENAATNPYESIYRQMRYNDIVLTFSLSLLPVLEMEEKDGKVSGDFWEHIIGTRNRIAKTHGIVIPTIRVMDNVRLADNEYEIYIHGKSVFKGCTTNSDNPPAQCYCDFLVTLEAHLPTLVTREMAKLLVDAASLTHPLTAEEAVPARLSYGGLAQLIRILLKRKKCLRNMYAILNHICDAAQVTDMEALAEEIIALDVLTDTE